jgi:hypothetical protein
MGRKGEASLRTSPPYFMDIPNGVIGAIRLILYFEPKKTVFSG